MKKAQHFIGTNTILMNNKSQYNPRIHNRRSIRLKGYDYSKEGLYFITFCCQNRANLFGEIITVGADLRVCPNEGKHGGLPQHLGSKLSSAIQWFKTMTTNEYIRGVKNLNWQSFDRRLWQRNYWEHIIRNEGAYDRISNYIKRNPSKWAEDQLFSKRKTK